MNGPRPLIAIVDDELAIRRALQRLMVSAGFQALTFGSGEEFLGSLGVQTPDCILLDLHMPEMSGFDVQSRLRDEHREIPVVIITGHDTLENQQRSLSGGAVAYLRKPVDDQTLIDAINTALAQGQNGSAN